MTKYIYGLTYLISNYMSNIELLPKWIMKRYLILWKELEDTEFDLDLAHRILLKTSKPDDKRVVALFLSELRKAGWLIVKFDPEDARKRIYKLKPYEQMFQVIVQENTIGGRHED